MPSPRHPPRPGAPANGPPGTPTAAKLLAVARDCGWTERGFRLVLASLAAKLAR